MNYAPFRDLKPFGKIVMAFLLMGACCIGLFILAMLAAVPMFGKSMGDIMEVLRSGNFSEGINLLAFLQITYSLGVFLIPALLAGLLFNGKSMEYLSGNVKPLGISLLLTVLVVLGSFPLINFLSEFNSNISLPERFSGLEERIRHTEAEAEELMNLFLSDTSVSRLLINLLMIAVVPAVGEEFFFRGVLQRIFTEWFRNKHAAIIVVAVLFSFMHLQFLGFIPRILLGAMFGYLFAWTGSIWVPVTAHFVNNTIAVAFYFFYNRGLIGDDLNTIGSEKGSIAYTLSSIIFLVVMMGAIRIAEKRKANRYQEPVA
jgi:membrane protease YdiL (CAAX protease family)